MSQPRSRLPFRQLLSAAQGGYYLLTGLWPILDSDSFQKITGPKTDVWLVKTTGALIATVGASLLLASARKAPIEPEITALGIGSAVSLGGADMVYSLKGRISKVYALEGVVELGIIGLWFLGIVGEDPNQG